MDFGQFSWYLLRQAFPTGWQIAANIAGVLAIILGIIVWRHPQWEATTKLLLWIVPLSLFVLLTPVSWLTTSYGIYKEMQQPKIDMEPLAQAFVKSVERIVEQMDQSDIVEQRNQSNIMEEAVGIIETAAGRPVYLVPPPEDPSKLGIVSQGSKQTFTGLTVNDSPIFMSIPKLGYAMIMINSMGNDTLEAVFMTYIEELSYAPFTLTLYIESQADLSQSIPARTTGFFRQKNEVPIHRKSGVDFGDMSLVIQIEAGVMEKID